MRAGLLLLALTGCAGPTPIATGTTHAGARAEVPARSAAPPVVESTDALLEHNRQWVELRGRVVVAEQARGSTAVTLTELALHDGLRVILAYGPPSAEWAGLLGQRVGVVGLLTLCGRLEAGESAGGPHLQRWETPRVLAETGAPVEAGDAGEGARRVLAWCRGGGGARESGE